MNYTPFVYLLKFLPTGQLYYGSRTAKNCQTSDLWTKYFSSSKIVKKLKAEHGKEAFEFEVRKTFETKAEALIWETRFLTRINAKRNPIFLNKSNGGKNFIGGELSDKHRRRISETHKGKTISDNHKRSISEFHTGKIISTEVREKIRLKLKGRTGPSPSQETRNKISIKTSEYNTGKPKSDNHRKSISETLKNKTPEQKAERVRKMNETKKRNKILSISLV